MVFLAVLMMFSAWPLTAWSGVPISEADLYASGRYNPANTTKQITTAPSVAGEVPISQAPAYARGQAMANEPATRTVYKYRTRYVPVTVPAETMKYVVVKGETATSIAKKFGAKSWVVIAAANRWTRWQANHIRAGQTILVPKPIAETKLGKAEAKVEMLTKENTALNGQVGAVKRQAAAAEKNLLAQINKKVQAAVAKAVKPFQNKLEAADATIAQLKAENAKLRSAKAASGGSAFPWYAWLIIGVMATAALSCIILWASRGLGLFDKAVFTA